LTKGPVTGRLDPGGLTHVTRVAIFGTGLNFLVTINALRVKRVAFFGNFHTFDVFGIVTLAAGFRKFAFFDR
jgi:hypothetical protein